MASVRAPSVSVTPARLGCAPPTASSGAAFPIKSQQWGLPVDVPAPAGYAD
jgi:hypothetical protein